MFSVFQQERYRMVRAIKWVDEVVGNVNKNYSIAFIEFIRSQSFDAVRGVHFAI